ncbi:MAG: RnfABCDGE type electron transport complex subunit G [Deltaproteobacteria bacterium]|uniref:Ion-translocating oxidoreductase complex subunit G n=1 Tax=Candidatus Zymogenus saltonus TaxID=2844893 RepID=A0A9D8PJA2_9DELT|nr:RnfABCDGE type electron transport complex subunit G [Candidatus Zymogenus saltonus]
MKEIGKLILVLTLICLAAAAALSQIEKLTREPIAQALREEKLKAIRKVLPEYDNEPDKESVSIVVGKDDSGKDIEKEYYIAKKGGDLVGVAFEGSSSEGYGGEIAVMIGVDKEDTINGIEIIKHAETPGLGSKITESVFLSIFKGRTLENTKWAVKKDGGDIDQITGATISPRAVVYAVDKELKRFSEHREEILEMVKMKKRDEGAPSSE